MNTSKDRLLAQESHFEFGKNWASYANMITEAQIDIAAAELQHLLRGRLDGKRFLDIGCGSGLHSLAALQLGASEVVAVDIDLESVETTCRVLARHAPGGPWRTLKISVFDVELRALGEFDVVYSWGVLHHTGDLYRALPLAAGMVRSGGQFAFALYRTTLLCWLWKIEKRWYVSATPRAQAVARRVYLAVFRLACVFTLRSYRKYVAEYRAQRGMDLFHDIHDCMGGWPYESILPRQVQRLMWSLGFMATGSPTRRRLKVGVFGSGCDEYLYSKAISKG